MSAGPADIELDGGRGAIRDGDRIGDWMQTWTGRRFYPADPRAEDVDILDIAFALSNIARYGGHCSFYSVAEHSVIVSRMVSRENAMLGLMHDATEAYIADVIRPVKRILGRENRYFDLERRVWLAVAERFGLPADIPNEVKIADTAICIIERRALHPRAQEWSFDVPTPKGVSLEALPPRLAFWQFLNEFCDITQMPDTERKGLERRADALIGEDRLNMAKTRGGLCEARKPS